MTQTNIEQDDLIIESLDFEFEPPCEWTAGECNSTAEWFWAVACCGAIYLVCEQHHQETLDYNKHNGESWVCCMSCGHETKNKNFFLSFGRI